jgi:hypothetical protein
MEPQLYRSEGALHQEGRSTVPSTKEPHLHRSDGAFSPYRSEMTSKRTCQTGPSAIPLRRDLQLYRSDRAFNRPNVLAPSAIPL